VEISFKAHFTPMKRLIFNISSRFCDKSMQIKQFADQQIKILGQECCYRTINRTAATASPREMFFKKFFVISSLIFDLLT